MSTAEIIPLGRPVTGATPKPEVATNSSAAALSKLHRIKCDLVRSIADAMAIIDAAIKEPQP